MGYLVIALAVGAVLAPPVLGFRRATTAALIVPLTLVLAALPLLLIADARTADACYELCGSDATSLLWLLYGAPIALVGVALGVLGRGLRTGLDRRRGQHLDRAVP